LLRPQKNSRTLEIHTHFHPRTRRSRNEMEHTLERQNSLLLVKITEMDRARPTRPTARSRLVFNNRDSRRRGNRSSYFGTQEGNTEPGITLPLSFNWLSSRQSKKKKIWRLQDVFLSYPAPQRQVTGHRLS